MGKHQSLRRPLVLLPSVVTTPAGRSGHCQQPATAEFDGPGRLIDDAGEVQAHLSWGPGGQLADHSFQAVGMQYDGCSVPACRDLASQSVRILPFRQWGTWSFSRLGCGMMDAVSAPVVRVLLSYLQVLASGTHMEIPFNLS